jgi:Na+/H+-dicarboxylate symporter
MSGDPAAYIPAALGALACIDIVMDMGRTFVNVVGNCIMTVLVYIVWSLLYDRRRSGSDR